MQLDIQIGFTTVLIYLRENLKNYSPRKNCYLSFISYRLDHLIAVKTK